MDLNASPSPFPIEEISEDYDHNHHPNFGHFFFNSTRDQAGYYHQQFYNSKEDEDHYSFNGGSSPYEMKNKVESSGLKLTLWENEDRGPEKTANKDDNNNNSSNNNPVKWMSSKMRVMNKINNNPDRVSLKYSSSSTEAATKRVENDHDKMQKPTSSMEADLSNNGISYNSNSPIRVCSDCNTTKTPLWRSGPKGPKSLCNACGIRQRKARRAMAAAATAHNGTMVPIDQPPPLKLKVQHKDKIVKNGNASHLKKRIKTTATHVAARSSSNNQQKKLGFEDFLIKLSKNLSFHRVFPEDERDAAILLMALSSGLVHG